jgi:O-antigen/teichoic acid export membrane protein
VRARTTIGGAPLMVVMLLGASIINYGSNVLFSRVLDPIGYGELTSLFALTVVLAVPTAAAQTVIAERIAVYTAEGNLDRVRYLVRYALAHIGVIALVAGVIYLALTPVVSSLLGLRHVGVAIALTPVLILAIMQPVALGVLQGLERFTAYGLVLLAVAVSRVAFGLPWAAVEHGAGGALGGQAVGMFVVLAVTLWLLRHLFNTRGTGAATGGLRRRPDATSLSASAAFIGFAILSNLDIILAKAFMSPHNAGVYAALSTVGKIITFLPTTIAVIMVPRAARAQSAGSSSRILRLSALLVLALALLAAIPAALVPRTVVQVMFGSKYLAAIHGVLPIVIAGACLAMTYHLVVYSVTIRNRRWIWLLVVAVALQIAGIATFHNTPSQVAIVQAAVSLFVLVGNEILFHPIILPRSLLPRGR